MRAHRFTRLLAALAIVCIVGAPLSGCSTTKRTGVTTVSSEDPTVVTTETETVVVEDDGCHGVLSCTTDFVGEVIALPFRLVGGLIRIIF